MTTHPQKMFQNGGRVHRDHIPCETQPMGNEGVPANYVHHCQCTDRAYPLVQDLPISGCDMVPEASARSRYHTSVRRSALFSASNCAVRMCVSARPLFHESFGCSPPRLHVVLMLKKNRPRDAPQKGLRRGDRLRASMSDERASSRNTTRAFAHVTGSGSVAIVGRCRHGRQTAPPTTTGYPHLRSSNFSCSPCKSAPIGAKPPC